MGDKQSWGPVSSRLTGLVDVLGYMVMGSRGNALVDVLRPRTLMCSGHERAKCTLDGLEVWWEMVELGLVHTAFTGLGSGEQPAYRTS